MKYILSVGIIAGFGYIGLCVRSYLNKREEFYKALISFIDQFIINVNFIQINFTEFLASEQIKNEELFKLLNHFRNATLNEDYSVRYKSLFLNDDEVTEVLELLNSIGSTDADNQIALLKGYKLRIEQTLLKCTESVNKYSSLSVKMSLILGCLVVLIFI